MLHYVNSVVRDVMFVQFVGLLWQRAENSVFVFMTNALRLALSLDKMM